MAAARTLSFRVELKKPYFLHLHVRAFFFAVAFVWGNSVAALQIAVEEQRFLTAPGLNLDNERLSGASHVTRHSSHNSYLSWCLF